MVPRGQGARLHRVPADPRPDGRARGRGRYPPGEGRNLQFCHVMVNMDLPWNPMQIEQRLGRLHRVG
jgi:helicase-like protein